MSDWTNGFRFERRSYFRFGAPEHRWAAEGASLALEFWARGYKAPNETEYRWNFGMEKHSAVPPSGNRAPSHGTCWCLSSRACWHDGSSSWGEEWGNWWKSVEPTDIEIFMRLSDELHSILTEVAQ